MIEEINLNLKAGETDSIGNKVSRVLSKDRDKKYAIWEIVGGDVLCDSDDDTIASHPEVSTWTIQVRGLIKSRKEFAGKYNSHLGHAYKLCFDGNPTAAIDTLKQTYDEISHRLIEESRLLYLIGSLIVALLCEAVLAYNYFYHPHNEFTRRLVAGLAVSVLGGLMSVASGLRNQTFEIPQRKLLVVVYGALRSIVALIAGFVAVLMINTGVALSFLQEHDAFGGFLLACFLAGFSERLVTTALRQIESTAG